MTLLLNNRTIVGLEVGTVDEDVGVVRIFIAGLLKEFSDIVKKEVIEAPERKICCSWPMW